MRSEIFYPGERLRPFIHSFVVTESVAESAYKVLPETGLVMGFQFKGHLSYVEGSHDIRLSRSGITGLRESCRTFKNSSDTGSVLVKFKPAGPSAFFRLPMHELFGKSISLDNLIQQSELALLEEELDEATTYAGKILVLEAFLYRRMALPGTDSLVVSAIAEISSRRGNVRIGDLAEKLNISQSPLEKRFRTAVGASPKKFASIVRLRHALDNFRSDNTLTDVAYTAGFYDQSHFINAFRKFAGESPESYLRKK